MKKSSSVRAGQLRLLPLLTVLSSGTLLFAAGPPASDDFNATSLNTNLWTLLNPVGDGGVTMTGTQLRLDLPAASNHDPSFGGANNSVRVVQSIANADFTVTAKFDSIPNQQYQFEGIVVDQDAANYLRFEFSSSSTELHVTAGEIVSQNETGVVDNPITLPSGTTSLWLRIQKAGNTWTETWSPDGTNFTSAGTFAGALTPADIGPFAGNYNPDASMAPAFSALVDSFITGAVPTPLTNPGANPTSDDFSGATLNSALWTFVNPMGDNYSLTGANLLIHLSGGFAHDPLANGGNYSSRVVQPMTDTDFGVEIKFDSVPVQTGTIQGILIQQDGSNFLRFEFQGGTGGSTGLYAGSVLASQPAAIYSNIVGVTGHSVWMRVVRSGNTWSLSWSPDGVSYQLATSFAQKLTVSAIGPMAGSFGDTGSDTPDFTASIDYFFNIASPIAPVNGGSPVISNVTGIASTTSAAVTWTTDENATSRVDYGIATSYGSTQSDPALATAHSVLLTGLACATPMNYAVTSVDAAGVSKKSANLTFTTAQCAKPSAPVSDSFDSTSLKTSLWSWIDPTGDSFLAFNGTTAQITVPANNGHDYWSLKGNATARIVQPVLNTDFDVAAKFVSSPIWANSGQGIVVEQDAFNYLLFDIRSDGTTTSFWAGSRAGAAQKVLINTPFQGRAPVWLRVTRVGSTWTLSWSADGNSYAPAGSFQQSLTVSSLGLYAANSGTTPLLTPAFTASVDSFVNVAAPVSNNAAPPPFSRVVIDPNPGTVLVQETMGDLDNDGRPDGLAGFASPNQGIVWYRSPHSGTLSDKWDRFVITPTGICYEDLIVFDVNGDGANDVIASIDGGITWFENPLGHGGDPTKDPWVAHLIDPVAEGENNFIMVDMDGDGQVDIVTPHSVYFRSGPDAWQKVDYNINFRGVSLLDIGSGKGSINIVGTDPNPPFSFAWFENPRETGGNARTGKWIEHTIGASYPCNDAPSCFGDGSVANLATGDLNGDGRMDLVTVQSEGYPVIPPGGLIWWEAPADRRNGAWIKHTVDPGFDSPHNAWVADVDKNGTLDIVVAQQEQSKERRIAVLFNDGKGNFSMQILSNTGSHNPFLTNINGDGWLDLFSAGHGRFGAPNPVELYINPRGGSPQP